MTERAYQVCGRCDLDPAEVDQLIANARQSTLSREESLELYYGMFERAAEAELCEDCAAAVLDAAVE